MAKAKGRPQGGSDGARSGSARRPSAILAAVKQLILYEAEAEAFVFPASQAARRKWQERGVEIHMLRRAIEEMAADGELLIAGDDEELVIGVPS